MRTQLYFTLTAIALVAFLISLDSFIINVAVPTISGELGVREDAGTWLITVFSTTSTLFVPIAGYLSMHISERKLFLSGLILFLLASLGCALSPHFNVLLFCRSLQGAGAGLLVPLSLALIIKNFPPEKRATGIGFWSFFVMVAPAMGPMIGGWLSGIRWQWMFFLNLPVGLFSFIILVLLLKEKETPIKKERSYPFDAAGILLLSIALTTLQMALNRWNIDDWFHSSFITILFIISALSLTFFIVWENFHPNPFMQLSQFRKRNFLLPALTTGLGMGILFSSFILDALWVQKVLGYTPGWAGLALAPVGFLSFLMYPIMGRFVSLLDLRIWILISFLLYAATFFWLSHINIYTPYSQLAFPRLIQGLGFALFTVPNSIYIVKGIKEEGLTEVISLFSFTRMLFVGFGVALAMTLWFFRQAYYQTIMMAKTYSDNPLLQKLLSTFHIVAKAPSQAWELTDILLKNQSSTLALADIYFLFAFLFLGLACSLLFYPSPKTSA